MHPERIKELILEVSPKWEDLQDLFAEITLNVKNHELISEGISAGIIQSRVRSVSNLRKRTGIDFNSIPEDRYSETWRIDFIKNNSNYNFFKNVEHLSTEHPVKSPKSIILTHEDDDILIIDDVSKYNEGKIRKYYIITAIWKILKSRSDDNTSNTITFLYKSKLQISNKYNTNILNKDFDGFNKFSSLLPTDDITNDKHHSEKNHILQNTLICMLENVNKEYRFGYILKNFDKFSLKFDENYQAYVVGFSFDKLREQHEEKYREFMVSIDNVISSILIKSLMIPTGVYLTATKTHAETIKAPLNSICSQLMTNLAIGVATLTIAIIFAMLLNNESYSISAIKFEYVSLMNRLQEKSSIAYKAIEEHKRRLSDRIAFSEKIIRYLHVINVLFLTFSIFWIIIKQFPIDITMLL